MLARIFHRNIFSLAAARMNHAVGYLSGDSITAIYVACEQFYATKTATTTIISKNKNALNDKGFVCFWREGVIHIMA